MSEHQDASARPDDGDTSTLPLKGVRVLDLSDETAVFGARLLADLGAEVVRVESATGDRLRRRSPFLDNQPSLEASLAHLLYNGGKKSVALALDVAESWEIIDRLAASADVILAPLNKSELARTFFDERRIFAVHGHIGIVDIVFRRGSPQAVVTDLIGVAAGGLLYINGFAHDPPTYPAGKLAYKQVAVTAALAGLSLVMAKRRSGKGGRITVSMQEAVMWSTLQTSNQNHWHWHRQRIRRPGLGQSGAGRGICLTSDGRWVSFTIPVSPVSAWDSFAAWVAEITGSDALRGEVWRDRAYRLEHSAEVGQAIQALCAALPRDRLIAEGQRRRLLVVPVNTVADVASDEHLHARGFFNAVHHPQFGRSLTLPRPPFLSSAYTPRARRAPMLGEHTRPVLQGLIGLTDKEISVLAARSIIHMPPIEPTEGEGNG